MDPGEVIAERFVLESRAGAGGMATVYRAHDRHTGGPVAIKVLERRDALNTERFDREARVLAELSHPALVRYVAHGMAQDGAPYLVMEWLEGSDLGDRLLRGPLGVIASVAVARRVAEALAVAHARGIIHRDLKPSNLFLVEGRIEKVKLVDFGLARPTGGDSATRTGASIGTPRFMAPEQVKGRRDLDARVDVYGLGGVLYACLAGQPAFTGSDNMAILAKVLLEEPTPVRELVPEVPDSLAQLVAEMLAKDRLDRPADASAVIARLDAIAKDPALDDAPTEREMVAVTGGEQRLLSVVLVDGRAEATPTIVEDPEATGQTRTESADLPAALGGLLSKYGERFAKLPDGSLVVTVSGAGTATDQSAQAARLALSIREQVPQAAIALATGRGLLAKRRPTGDVIDRAATILRRARSRGRRAIVIDDVTEELLGDRFAVRRGEAGTELLREKDGDPTRTLLGRATSCVGRDAELAMLEAVWDQSVGDGHARAVLVTGDAGVGKSRLRYELVRRLVSRTGYFQMWIGRGDPMRAGAAFGLLAPAIRRACGVLEGEPLEVRQIKLRARLGARLQGDDHARVTEFLGELVGVPFSDEHSGRLRAARHDARLMNEQMRRAWEDWVAAETASGPLLIVLEDLHWGDWPTVKFIDSMLIALAERPILVLALARPDVKAHLPGLWEGRPVSEIALGSLSRRASERLVREVLGEKVGAPTVAKLVEQSAGNALFLEELIRAAATGKGDALPESVLAMMQARLDRLPAEARRVLRAASVFSNCFWTAGVQKLVGMDLDVGDWITFLDDEEVIGRRGDRKFPGQDEHVFRHALVREAAYSLLTESDRRLGHRQAAEWLEQVGETDALVLAEHWERGGELERAASWYQRAAEQALDASDLAGVTERVERGLACLDQAGAREKHAVRGALHLIEAQAHAWNGQFSLQEEAAKQAMACLDRGEPAWCRAAAELASAYGYLGQQDRLHAIGETLQALGTLGTGHRAYVHAAASTGTHLLLCGQYALAELLFTRVRPHLDTFAGDDPLVAAAILRFAAARALSHGDLYENMTCNVASIDSFERAGDLASAYRQRGNLASVQLALGAYAEARELLTEVITIAERLGLSSVVAVSRSNLGLSCVHLGQLDDARAHLVRSIDEYRAIGMRRTEAAAHGDLALALLGAGDSAAAARAADTSVALSAEFPPTRAYCLARRAQVALAQGRGADALADAGAAVAILDELGGLDRTDAEPLIRVTYAEALHDAGDPATARTAIAHARARIEEVAARIGDPAWRASFVERNADNAHALTLERAWGVA
ncbi:MAG TPA: protein kinase [Kofleriaceae bacterium]|nr:protein kinase [Kofleriaceae bacterium]